MVYTSFLLPISDQSQRELLGRHAPASALHIPASPSSYGLLVDRCSSLPSRLIGFKYIRRFTYWSVSQLRLMCLPSGRPAHPSRLESYFKWTASKEGEGLLWGGIIFRGFLIQEVKLAGARAGERQGGEGGEGWRSGRGWYRWTVYKGQRCHRRALHLLCQLP